MKRWLRLACGFVLGLDVAAAVAQTSPAAIKPADDKHFVALAEVVTVVENVLAEVQGQIQKTDPQLKSAEFDFQTTSTSNGQGGVVTSLLTLQAAHEKNATREIDFTYSVPPQAPRKEGTFGPNSLSAFGWVRTLWDKLHATAKPEDFNTTLPAAIIAAAMTTRQVRTIANPGGTALSHRTVSVTLSFAVSNSFNVGGDASMLLMVEPQVHYGRTSRTTQTVKLTFEDPA